MYNDVNHVELYANKNIWFDLIWFVSAGDCPSRHVRF